MIGGTEQEPDLGDLAGPGDRGSGRVALDVRQFGHDDEPGATRQGMRSVVGGRGHVLQVIAVEAADARGHLARLVDRLAARAAMAIAVVGEHEHRLPRARRGAAPVGKR